MSAECQACSTPSNTLAPTETSIGRMMLCPKCREAPKRRAVADGQINFLSVSSVTMFDPGQDGGCPRAWNFRYVQGVKKPETDATDRGALIHKQIEHYYRTGEDVLTPIVRVGKHFMPARGDDLLIEYQIDESSNILTAAGVPFRLMIDLTHSRGAFVDSAGEIRHDPPHTSEVLDWKSTSNLTAYAKRGPDLIKTVQMTGYGETLSRLDPTLEHVRLSHVYFQTRGAKYAEKRTALFLIETVKHRWQAVDQVVREMIDVARESDPLRVDANYDSCGAYGGCFYRDRCPRSPERVITDLFGKGKGMSLLKALQSQTGLTGPDGTPAPATTAPQVAASAPQPGQLVAAAHHAVPVSVAGVTSPDILKKRAEIEAQLASLQAEEAALKGQAAPAPIQPATAAPACPICGEVYTIMNVSRLQDGTLFHVGCPRRAGVTPPDAPRSTLASSAAPVPVEVLGTLPPAVAAATQAHAAAVAAASPPTPATVPAATAPSVATPAPATPGKRGRKPRTQAAGGAANPPASGEGLTLFCDVIALKGMDLQSLDPYIDDICDRISEAAGTEDIRFTHNESAISFGKWRGALAAAVKSSPPAPGQYAVQFVRESEIKQVVVEALISIADIVVRGL